MTTSGSPSRAPTATSAVGVREGYAAHGAEIYRFALRAVRDQAGAQDVVQETFLRAWRARDRFDPQIASLRTWLFSIARNVVIDQSRHDDVRPWLSALADPESMEQVSPTSPDQWEPLLRRWLVEEALSRIGADHRQAVVETYLADRPYDVVAGELGIPVSTLRSRVFYGLKALRVAMDEMGVTL